MISTILGKKLGMTSIFDENGRVVPVTVIEVGPVVVMQVKTPDNDGYAAVQLGFSDKKLQRATKSEVGHAKKAGSSPKKVLREIRVGNDDLANLSPGQQISLADTPFSAGDRVDVIGTSIGKGYAGVIKRHNFHGYDKSHGTHEYQRHGGSIGTATTPGRVLKGKKMAGHMGNARVTVKNLTVAAVKPEENLMLIKGALPGSSNSIVMIRLSRRQVEKEAAA